MADRVEAGPGKGNGQKATIEKLDEILKQVNEDDEDLPLSWSHDLPDDERFELVLDEAAVLDKETGLVWERSPSTVLQTWPQAQPTSIDLGVAEGKARGTQRTACRQD
jgi:hypothetical protein